MAWSICDEKNFEHFRLYKQQKEISLSNNSIKIILEGLWVLPSQNPS